MSSPSPHPAPAPPDRTTSDRLGLLRAELDQIDDTLHDALMRRAELVEQVGALGAKGRVPLRPGREASILRRLLARNQGALAPATVVRVWRELLAGSSAQQSPMTVAVAGLGLLPIACEHFGALIPTISVAPDDAIERVRNGRVTVAVLPWPDAAATWWTLLMAERWPRIHAVARLPFWGRRDAAEAVVLSAAPPDPSGSDRSLLGLTTADGAETLGRRLAAAGFAVGPVVIAPGRNLALADVAGFVAGDDDRLYRIAEPTVVLGAYANPVGDFA